MPGGRSPQGRLPGDSIPRSEINQQIGRFIGVKARIDLLARNGAAHSDPPARRVRQSGERSGDACLQGFGFARIDNALLLAAFQVEVYAAESERIGFCFAPIHAPKKIARLFARLHSGAKSEQSLIVKPGVKVNSALEAVHAVVAERDEERFVVGVLHSPSDHRVAGAIALSDDAIPLRRRAVAIGWMILFAEA